MMPAATLDMEEGAEMLRALAHGVRLSLLKAMIGAERSVGEIETMTGVGQPGLSQQLAILRKAGLVSTRREAKQIFYSIDRARLDALCGLMEMFRGPGATPPEPGAASLQSKSGAAVFARIG